MSDGSTKRPNAFSILLAEAEQTIRDLRSLFAKAEKSREWDREQFRQGVDAWQKRIAEAEKQESRGCPCTLTKPCMDVCSCANMVYSGGCLRCCRYGSEDQRKERAEIIANVEKQAAHHKELLMLAAPILDAVDDAAKRVRFTELHGIS